VSADGLLMFFNSNRRADRPWATFNLRSRRFDDDIWVASRIPAARDQERWSPPVNLGAPINSSGDEEIAALAPDGQRAYFTSLRPGWEADGGPYYVAALHGSAWTSLKGLGGGITDFFRDRDRAKSFRVYGASISPDGRAFYFATTANSTNGEQQIWVSHLGDSGWEYPRNLGPRINGVGGSCAPFIAADGKTLFFAARRADGFGGDDVYMTVMVAGRWQEPENVGAPINTSGDDQFLSVPAAGERVYLSSSRDGNEDIFTAPLPEILRPGQVVLLAGRVTDKTTGRPIGAEITIEDIATGLTVYSAASNSESGRYTLVLEPGRDYAVTLSSPGHGFSSHRYALSAASASAPANLDVALSPLRNGEEFLLRNIFFDFNSESLRAESRLELNRLVALLRNNPALRITVCGHTDSVGSGRYNQRLSMRRAEEVRDYLTVKGGINPRRVGVRGYGATMPAASNDSEEGRQQNRRIAFVIEATE
jgi:outer membrane protein OmpA-like peptidoglycan-associated protein